MYCLPLEQTISKTMFWLEHVNTQFSLHLFHFWNKPSDTLISYIRFLRTLHLNLFLGYRPISGVLTKPGAVISKLRARIIGYIRSLASSASYFSQKLLCEMNWWNYQGFKNVYSVPLEDFSYPSQYIYTMSIILRQMSIIFKLQALN